MKFLVVLLVLLAGSLASASLARTIDCFNPNVQDSYYTTTFRLVGSELGGESASVELRMPRGEFPGEAYEGTCEPGGGAPEARAPLYSCLVKTPVAMSYWVMLWTNSEGEFEKATVQSAMMRGEDVLPVCKVR